MAKENAYRRKYPNVKHSRFVQNYPLAATIRTDVLVESDCCWRRFLQELEVAHRHDQAPMRPASRLEDLSCACEHERFLGETEDSTAIKYCTLGKTTPRNIIETSSSVYAVISNRSQQQASRPGRSETPSVPQIRVVAWGSSAKIVHFKHCSRSTLQTLMLTLAKTKVKHRGVDVTTSQ